MMKNITMYILTNDCPKFGSENILCNFIAPIKAARLIQFNHFVTKHST